MIGDKQRFRVISFDMYLHESKKFYVCVFPLEHESGSGATIRITNKDFVGFTPVINNMLEAMGMEPIVSNTIAVLNGMTKDRVRAHKNKYVAIDTISKPYINSIGEEYPGIAFASDTPFHKTYQKIGANIIQPNS